MTLQEKIKADMVAAMKSKDPVRVGVLRGLSAAFTNELVAKKKMPNESLSDEDSQTVIMRAIKQRKDSIDQFKKGGREDLVAAETAELRVIEEYAPKLMSPDEVAKIAAAKKAELGVTDKSKMGQLMGTLMKELKGKADGADVKAAVEALFS